MIWNGQETDHSKVGELGRTEFINFTFTFRDEIFAIQLEFKFHLIFQE